MTPRTCRYGCGMLLEGWDDNARKYIESGSGGLHTKERCQEAKLKLELKNNHGNEESKPVSPKEYFENKFIDHTLAATAKLNLKILTDPTPEGLSLLYNSFGESHNIRFSQYHPQGSLYTIAVFFEEIKQ